VLFVGTSLTAGLGLDPAEAYPALVQERIDSAGLGYRVVNAGLSGETSAGALRRIEWLLQQPVEIVVLETGANDGLRGLNVDSTRANIQTTVERIQQAHPGAEIFLVQMEAPTNLGPRYTTAFRGMFPAVAQATGVTLVPFLLDGVAGVRTLNQSDGIHPNAEGARIMADIVWRSLSPALEGGRGR
jgi:acyl-CoA thioesterase I